MRAGLLLTIFLLPWTCRAQVPDPMVAHEIALLEFAGGGSPLTPAEREEAAGAVQEGMRVAPTAWTELDAKRSHDLQAAAHASPAAAGALRLSWRLGAARHLVDTPALAGIAGTERRIIEAHDPVLVFDAEHGWLVTAHTIRVLAQALPAGARALGLPPPGPDAGALMARNVTQFLPTLQEPGHDGYTRAEQVLAGAVPWITRLPASQRDNLRNMISQLPDEATRDLNIARAMVIAGRNASRPQMASGGSPGFAAMAGHALRMQDLMQRQMLGSIRRMSPSCNVYTGTIRSNPVFCNP